MTGAVSLCVLPYAMIFRTRSKRIRTAVCALLCVNVIAVMTSCGDVDNSTTLKKIIDDSRVTETAAPTTAPATGDSSVAETAPTETTPTETAPADTTSDTEIEVPDSSETETTTQTTIAPVTAPPEETKPTATTADKTPPVIAVNNFSVYKGDGVSYKKYVTVTDNSSPAADITIEIDSSAVDLDTLGTYPVTYKATDKAGNSNSVTVNVSVVDRPPNPATEVEAYVKSQAQQILAKITNANMNQMQKAYAIWYWTRHNISYVDSSDKSNWLTGARDGFQKRWGDCYTYFAVSKALLTEAGIQNVDVVKQRASTSDARHYWLLVNTGDGWYHFDTTPYRAGGDNFFMLTDAELKAWDNARYPGCHNFSNEGLPERNTVSVQSRINYYSSTLN